VEALWRRLPGLDRAAREEIDAMSRHLARNLLRTPLARLAEDADGRREQAARDLFGL
jgi:glutamyl-tRNA reductase